MSLISRSRLRWTVGQCGLVCAGYGWITPSKQRNPRSLHFRVTKCLFTESLLISVITPSKTVLYCTQLTLQQLWTNSFEAQCFRIRSMRYVHSAPIEHWIGKLNKISPLACRRKTVKYIALLWKGRNLEALCLWQLSCLWHIGSLFLSGLCF